MKRPLACTSLVFVMVLLMMQIGNITVVRQSPIKTFADGQMHILGHQQGDTVVVCGTVSDYSFENQYGKTTTEIILKDIQILPPSEDKSKSNYFETFQNHSDIESNFQSISKIGQSIIVYLNNEYYPVMGSQIILSGELAFWKKATNPGEFDAEKFYTNRGVLFAVKKADVIKVSISGNKLLQGLKEFRLKQEAYLEKYLPDGNDAIMKAMLLGNKKEMDEDTKALYQKNGIAHILAISGLHISLLGMSVYNVFLRFPFPKWVILSLSGSFLILYCLMVGFSASAFRAFIMFSFFLVSKLVKRSYDMITAMAFSVMVWLMIYPEYLFDCGFQLSYAAIIGIGILKPVLEEITDTIRNKWFRKGIKVFLPSLSVNLMTAPILIYHYYELSFFSIALNLIVLPLMTPLLLCGICMLIMANMFGNISGIAPTLCAISVNLMLWIFEMGCRFLELFPIGRRNIAPLPIGEIILYYSILFVMTVLVKKKSHIYQFIFPTVCILMLIIPQKLDFSVWTLDVGQGDCNVIFTKEGNCFVIDCGSTSKYNVGEKILIPFLKYHGVASVDGVIISHPDADHMNGVLELMELGEEENIDIKGIYIYEKGPENEPGAWEEVLGKADEKEIFVSYIGQGDVLRTDSLEMECIYPLEEQEGLTGNAASLVMSVKCEEFRGLFTGDMETEGERILLNEYGESMLPNEYGESMLPNEYGESILPNGDGESMLPNEYVESILPNEYVESILPNEYVESILPNAHGEQMVKTGKYDFLKVGHHGSATSTGSDFLQWVKPKYAVISCGENNSYGHPHVETLKSLAAVGSVVMTTPECGAVTIEASLDGRILVSYWGNHGISD